MTLAKNAWSAIWVLSYAVIGVIYFNTSSSVPTSDGFAWVSVIDHRNWVEMFRPYHALPLPFILLTKTILAKWVHCNISTLELIQTINLVQILLTVYFLNRLFSYLLKDSFFAWIGSMFFVFTFAIWYFSNGEIHHFALIFLALTLLKLHEFYNRPNVRSAILIGLLHGLTIAFHQEHLLMVAPIVWIMFYEQLSVKRLILFFAYIASLTAFLSALFVTIAAYVYHVENLSGFRDWFFQIESVGNASGYHYFAMRPYQFFYWAKGFLMSINYGAQIVADFVRYPEIRQLQRVQILLPMTLVGLVLILVLSIKAISGVIAKGKSEAKDFALGFFVWLIIYQVLFNFRYVPESPEYYIGSLIPVTYLLLFGACQFKRKVAARGCLIVLLGVTFTVTLFGAILPWRRHGEMMNRFRHFANQTFTRNDLFISTESNLDQVIASKFDHISLKKIYLENNREKAFSKLTDLIEEALIQKRRVFMYNTTPSPYALKRKTNKQDPNNLYSMDEIKRFFGEMEKAYLFTRVFEYWESTTSQIYLFDIKKDYVCQVQKK